MKNKFKSIALLLTIASPILGLAQSTKPDCSSDEWVANDKALTDTEDYFGGKMHKGDTREKFGSMLNASVKAIGTGFIAQLLMGARNGESQSLFNNLEAFGNEYARQQTIIDEIKGHSAILEGKVIVNRDNEQATATSAEIKEGEKLTPDENRSFKRLKQAIKNYGESKTKLEGLKTEIAKLKTSLEGKFKTGKMQLPTGAFDEHGNITKAGVDLIYDKTHTGLRRFGKILAGYMVIELGRDVWGTFCNHDRAGLVPTSLGKDAIHATIETKRVIKNNLEN